MNRDRPTKLFIGTYYHDGARWGLTVHAYDWADAQARCLKLGVQLDGELMARIPAGLGWFAKAACYFRNLFVP